ncbi:MAG: helicase-related protein [Nannocystaceae bacterium]|nr:helicase-related protein [bacterium]
MHPLPIDALQQRFVSACRPGARLVVSAPTGSGKSTRLPWWMADALGGRVLVVEPRRVAARALATHGAKIRGESVGARVGYRVRFDAAESDDTQILFVTPGMALALLSGEAPGFAGVLVDEFHERGWETDLVTALVRSGRLGPDAALVVCSATLARDALCEALGAAALSGEGRAFDVSLRWSGDGGPSLEGLPDRVRAAVHEALKDDDGDVLVFLPGKREISGCAAALSDLREADVVPLHGGLSSAQMQRVLGPSPRRRVFLATNVAETSLTIPSVTAVIDSGLERRHVHRGGKVVLAVVPISLASAEQRRGRAGRVRAGTCTRLWSEAFVLSENTPPQIERIDLDDVLLRAGMCGVPPAEAPALPWVTSPPRFAVDAALSRLVASGAVGVDGGLTSSGRVQAKLPVSWAAARVLTDPPAELASALCDVVAVMEVGRDLLDGRCSEAQAADRADLFHGAKDEVEVALRCLREGDARRHGLRGRTLEECRRLSRSLARAIGAKGDRAADPRALARCIAAAVPELVFVRRPRADKSKGKPSRGGEPWGNGEVEIFVQPYAVPSVEAQPPGPAAGVVLEREWLGVGHRARGVGRLLMRLEIADLASLGLGEASAGEIRVVRRRVVAEVTRSLAGVELSREVEPLEGEALADALVTLVLRGTLMKGLAPALLDALHAWSVLAAWGRREGTALPDPPPDAATYLRARLQTLGVEGLEDLSLLEPDDVLPAVTPMAVEAGMDPRLATALPEDLPRTLELPGGRYACTVDVSTRTVELAPLGKTKKEPAVGLLPRFRGFSVVFVKASRRLRLR